jgi:RNA polymerase sigma factor (sigma-70 family)
MITLTDNELIELARNDSEEAKLELYARCKNVITYSVRRAKIQCWDLNQSDVEDLTSECWIAVMEAIKLYKPERGASFAHFLKFVIRPKFYKFIEKRIEISDNVLVDYKLETIMAAEDITRDLTIKVKNERDRYIIELFLAGMRQTDIADEMKITRGRVNQIIKECIK